MAPFIGVLSTLFALNGSSRKTKNYRYTPSSSLHSTNTNVPTTVDTILPKLCHLFRASPTDTLSLRTNDNGLRGIYTDKPVGENDVILRIPLSSCITDAEPPRWLREQQQGGSSDDDDSTFTANAVSVEGWVTRLTANLLESYKLNNDHTSDEWFQLFPTNLREILPIHWDTELFQNDNLLDTRLEMAVDSAYFARAEMVSVLVASLTNANLMGTVTERDVEHCLDLVQTRSCRVESSDGSSAPPLRVLAPIFDMINHSPNPNAECIREGDTLEVRALRDMSANDELFISYGPSTQPAWKCLFSYGFVPQPAGNANANDETNVYETDAAELKVDAQNGTLLRFEVSPVDIPLELIRYEATGSAWDNDQTTEQCLANPVEEEMGLLTVEVGKRLLERIRVAAGELEGGGVNTDGPEGVAVSLLADLKVSNQRTLLACANGLQEFLDEM